MYLQITQAAKLLRFSRQWVYTLIDRDEINVVELAGFRFVLQDDKFKALQRARKKKNGSPK